MSTISSTADRGEAGNGGLARAASAALQRWWVAYINWRIELLAATRPNLRPGSRAPAPRR